MDKQDTVSRKALIEQYLRNHKVKWMNLNLPNIAAAFEIAINELPDFPTESEGEAIGTEILAKQLTDEVSLHAKTVAEVIRLRAENEHLRTEMQRFINKCVCFGGKAHLQDTIKVDCPRCAWARKALSTTSETAVIIHKERRISDIDIAKCPECRTEFQTGSESMLQMPYCGSCGKIVLDATQRFCCWCGCNFGIKDGRDTDAPTD